MLEKDEINEDKVGIKARSVLWYLTFVGFAMNYMIRININITIVDMISPEYKSNAVSSSECVSSNFNSTLNGTIQNEHYVLDDNTKYISMEKRFLDYIGVSF